VCVVGVVAAAAGGVGLGWRLLLLCVCVGVVVVFLLLECVVCVQKRVRLLVLIVVGGGGCRFANSLAYNAPTTCSFAEFSSKWRNGFLNFVAHPLTARLSKSGVRRTALMAGAVV
jgi:hypothetical protein